MDQVEQLRGTVKQLRRELREVVKLLSDSEEREAVLCQEIFELRAMRRFPLVSKETALVAYRRALEEETEYLKVG